MIKRKALIISLLGIGASQGLLFICFALIGRNWGQEALGDFNLSFSLGSIIGMILALRFELACVQSSQEESYRALIHATLLGIIIAISLYIVSRICNIDLPHTTLLFALALLLQQSISTYLSATEKYKLIATLRILPPMIFAAGLAIYSSNQQSQTPFSIYAYACIIISTTALAFITTKNRDLNKINIDFYLKNKALPQYSLPAAILGSALTNALPIILPILFGSLTAGLFAATQRFGFAPVSFTAQGISSVFRREITFAISTSTKQARSIYLAHLKPLILLAASYLIIGNIAFTLLIDVILGEDWHGATVFFHIISPLYALNIIYTPLSQTFIATRSLKTDLLMQGIIFTTAITPLYIAYLTKASVIDALIWFTSSSSFALLLGIWLSYVSINQKTSTLN